MGRRKSPTTASQGGATMDRDASGDVKSLSIAGLEDVEPYGGYAEMRREGDIRYDPGMKTLTAQSYAACQEIFRADKEKFAHPDADPGADYQKVAQGRRHPKTLDGDEHTRLHNWLFARF